MPHRLPRARLAGGCLFVFALAAAGCSSKPAALSGTVSYNGKLITAGTITMIGEDNKVVTCDINPDGTYSIAVAPGKVLVGVATPPTEVNAFTQQRTTRTGRQQPNAGELTAPKEEVRRAMLPAKAAHPDTSGIVIDVKSGPQTVNIEVPD